MTKKKKVLHLHERLTRQLFSMLAVCLAVPNVLPKESFSFITNLAALTVVMIFFFFMQKTAYEIRKGDWSSDVCSSDLECPNSAKVPSVKPGRRLGAGALLG